MAAERKIASARALATLRHAQIQQQGEPRLQAHHALFEFGDEIRGQPAAAALVGVAGIGEAVADHPGATRQRRLDGFAHVLRPRGEHQQQFGFGGGRLVLHAVHGHVEQQAADLFGQRRAAGLAGGHHVVAGLQQRIAQCVQHGGLARALAAFQRNEMRVALQSVAGNGGHCETVCGSAVGVSAACRSLARAAR